VTLARTLVDSRSLFSTKPIFGRFIHIFRIFLHIQAEKINFLFKTTHKFYSHSNLIKKTSNFYLQLNKISMTHSHFPAICFSHVPEFNCAHHESSVVSFLFGYEDAGYVDKYTEQSTLIGAMMSAKFI
jgi:hypothetical protein